QGARRGRASAPQLTRAGFGVACVAVGGGPAAGGSSRRTCPNADPRPLFFRAPDSNCRASAGCPYQHPHVQCGRAPIIRREVSLLPRNPATDMPETTESERLPSGTGRAEFRPGSNRSWPVAEIDVGAAARGIGTGAFPPGIDRRGFLRTAAGGTAAIALASMIPAGCAADYPQATQDGIELQALSPKEYVERTRHHFP